MPFDEAQSNFDLFRDCLSGPLVQRSAIENAKVSRKRRTRGRKYSVKHDIDAHAIGQGGAEELAEFIDYLATEIFDSSPQELQSLSYSAIQNDPRLAERFLGDPFPPATLDQILASIPPSVGDSLDTYSLIDNDQSSLPKFLTPIFRQYVDAATAAPPTTWSTTRTSACEMCERDWIPLSYHHLIPKQMHAKAVKRGWHEEWRLNSVAWLCRACHSFVHRVASNEELAREYWSMERLMRREDVVAWAAWVGRVRWKAR